MPKVYMPNSNGRQRVYFFCPACKCAHGINDGWFFSGDIEKPTISPSVLSNKDSTNPAMPVCHSFVHDGKIQFLPDCTHELAGQTVDLPDWK